MKEPLFYIIDDDKANNTLTRIMLEEAGLNNLRQFRMAQEALDELKRVSDGKMTEEYPTVILLDINMPAMDGWEFMNQFRTFPAEFNSLPKIYLLTSSDYPGDIAKAKNYPEVLDFLGKPISEETAQKLKDNYLTSQS
ncbi:MAG: response regulator [Bacteroidetes bacterium]|nr:response regulator [Bacteroidota bacterium]